MRWRAVCARAWAQLDTVNVRAVADTDPTRQPDGVTFYTFWQQLVADLLARAFEGSADKLSMHALSAQSVSREELAEIRNLLDRIEREQQ